MLRNLLKGVLAAASQGEAALSAIAARKARQEREEAEPIRRPGVPVDYKTPERETKAEARRRRRRERPAFPLPAHEQPSAKERRLLRFARAKASGAISFRPLGSPLTMHVRKGLRWGHLSLDRRLRTGLAARDRKGLPRNADVHDRTPSRA